MPCLMLRPLREIHRLTLNAILLGFSACLQVARGSQVHHPVRVAVVAYGMP